MKMSRGRTSRALSQSAGHCTQAPVKCRIRISLNAWILAAELAARNKARCPKRGSFGLKSKVCAKSPLEGVARWTLQLVKSNPLASSREERSSRPKCAGVTDPGATAPPTAAGGAPAPLSPGCLSSPGPSCCRRHPAWTERRSPSPFRMRWPS